MSDDAKFKRLMEDVATKAADAAVAKFSKAQNDLFAKQIAETRELLGHLANAHKNLVDTLGGALPADSTSKQKQHGDVFFKLSLIHI